MKITPERFYEWLKEYDFYDQWIEGYNLDNEIYDDIVPLDKFFNDCPVHLWLYSGPSAMAMLGGRPEEEGDLQNRYDKWRKDNLTSYMNLDEAWMDYVKAMD